MRRQSGGAAFIEAYAASLKSFGCAGRAWAASLRCSPSKRAAVMTVRLKSALIALAAGMLGLAASGQALAWGSSGHRYVGQVGAEAFPATLPAFLRTKQTAFDIGELARELDRSKGSGRIHDSDRDPGHFADIDDSGGLNGGPKLVDLPPTREAYEKALQAAATDSWQAGYSPYAIIDGWQQLVTDFTYYRILTSAVKHEKNPARKRWYKEDLTRRQALTIRNIGVWAHYIGDGSQPLHDTWHYNGWGAKFPNPKGYTLDPIHSPFEDKFVADHVTIDMVRAKVPAPRDCGCDIQKRTIDYLLTGNSFVEPLYQMWKDGEFDRVTPKAIDFTTTRIAAGAAEVRDMVVSAWIASSKGTVGYKDTAITPAEAEAGKDAWISLYGNT